MKRLDFTRLYKTPMQIVILSDVSFANASRLKFQLGYDIFKAEKECSANIILHTSSGCYCVSRFVMAAEMRTLVRAVDTGIAIEGTLNQPLSREVEMEVYGDCYSLFCIIAKYINTAVRRLQIDVFVFEENY